MFRVFPPVDVAGNGGPTGPLESEGLPSEECKGAAALESKGADQLEKKGHKGTPIKATQRKKPIEGDTPARERHPLVLSESERAEIDADFEGGDAAITRELQDFNDRNEAYRSNATGFRAFRGHLVSRGKRRRPGDSGRFSDLF